MKKTIVTMVAFATMLCVCPSVSAQGFLKKATTSVSKATSTVSKAANKVIKTMTIKYDSIPNYSIKAVKDGTKNADGTEKVAYYLVDQNGNIRTTEAIKVQHKEITKALTIILAKVGGGAAIGAASGGAAYAAVGAATGGLASVGDIKQAVKLKKSMDQQKKLLETYEKNFTKEGQPTSAKVDVSKIEGIDAEPMTVDTQKLNDLLAKADDSSTSDFLSE